ncbi:MAG TPA: winged helix-turn-helix domain-containing protein [Solirubrobacterales bacterium]|nr:winged helix-turn-helix domain-containing protein [Solirubrobacterales bacterium]
MPGTKTQTSSELVGKAFAHPARGEALTVLTERTASPTELADELGLDVRYLSYHVKLLRDWGLIELVGEKPRRGATEHFYRATTRTLIDKRSWERLPRPLQEDNCGQVMQQALDDFTEAAKAGTLVARPDIYLGRTLLDVDEQGWQEASELVQRAAGELLEIQARSMNRIAASGEAPLKASGSMLLFEVPQPKVAAS